MTAASVVCILAALALVTTDSRPADATWTRAGSMWESDGCGTTETLTVPSGVTMVRILAVGGGGGRGGNQFTGSGGAGAIGASVQDTYPVTAGTQISMVVGCQGASGSAAPNNAVTPGWATGGGAGIGSTSIFEGGASGGAGGGATGVCIGSATCAPGSASLRLVAGGGGGGGVANCGTVDATNSRGGRGGSPDGSVSSGGGGIGLTGADGATSNGAGGIGGVNTGGSPNGATSANGSGGLSVNVVGGGGGGGFGGGGAGTGADTGCVGGGGGGGGSSWFTGSSLAYVGGSCAACVSEPGHVNVVALRPVTTELTSGANPSIVGHVVHLQARIFDSDGPHTYTDVEFTVDGVLVGTDQTDLAGVASISRTFSTAGSFTVEARPITSFSAGPSSDSLVQQVEVLPPPVATVSAVSSSPNPSVADGPVTFTATVTASGTPVTAGTVTFHEGGTILAASRALDPAGQVSFTTATLPVGSHTIAVAYSGAPGFVLSAADVVHVVDPLDTSTTTSTSTTSTSTTSTSTTSTSTSTTTSTSTSTSTSTTSTSTTPPAPGPDDPGADPSRGSAGPTDPGTGPAGSPAASPARSSRPASTSAPSSLPRTGGEPGTLILIGALLTLSGAAVVALHRRRGPRGRAR